MNKWCQHIHFMFSKLPLPNLENPASVWGRISSSDQPQLKGNVLHLWGIEDTILLLRIFLTRAQFTQNYKKNTLFMTICASHLAIFFFGTIIKDAGYSSSFAFSSSITISTKEANDSGLCFVFFLCMLLFRISASLPVSLNTLSLTQMRGKRKKRHFLWC